MAFAIVWQVLYYTWFASEIAIAIGTRTRNSSGNVRDRGTLYLLWAVIFVSMTVGLSFTEARQFGVVPNTHWLRWVALAMLIAGLALRWTAIFTLGKSFSSNVAIHASQTVLKTGLYRWMRHPSYTGLIMVFVATGLRTRNWLSFLIITVPTTAALLYRIHVEEAALRGHFGAEYVEYSRQTKRLIPGVY